MNWLRRVSTSILGTGGVQWMLRPAGHGRATVLMMHRFTDPEAGIRGHDPGLLRRRLAFLRRNRYPLLSIDEVCQRLVQERPLPARTVVFTVDDGYADLARVAAPVFAEFDCPVTIFPVTGFLDREVWLWWDRVEHVFLQTRRSSATIDFGRGPEGYAWWSREDRKAVARRVSARLKRLSRKQRAQVTDRLATELEVDLSGCPPPRYEPMTWDDVRYWSQRGMIVGSHTETHPILTQDTEHEVRKEIESSRDRILEEVGKVSGVFCYPDGTPGSYSDRERRLLKQAGFIAALTSIQGYVRFGDPGRGDPRLFDLPRIVGEAPEGSFRLSVAGLDEILGGGLGPGRRGAGRASAPAKMKPQGWATVLMVAYHFAPDTASGTHRSLHFARALHEAGFRVLVLTRSLDSLELPDPSLTEVFPHEDRVVRVPRRRTLGDRYLRVKKLLVEPAKSVQVGEGTEARNRNPLRWLRRQLSSWDGVPDVERAWYANAVRAGLELASRDPVDVVFATGPPWTGLRVGRALSRTLGCPLISDFRDPWTANTGRVAPFPTAWWQWLTGRWERSVVRDSDRVLFASWGIMEATVLYCPWVRTLALETIPNGSNVPLSARSSLIEPGLPLTFRHFGSLYGGRSVAPLIAALDRLEQDGFVRPGDVSVELVGGSEADTVRSLAEHPSRSIEVLTRPPMAFRDAVLLM